MVHQSIFLNILYKWYFLVYNNMWKADQYPEIIIEISHNIFKSALWTTQPKLNAINI